MVIMCTRAWQCLQALCLLCPSLGEREGEDVAESRASVLGIWAANTEG